MSLLIRNGEIVTATRRYRADILCEGETLTRIGPRLSAPRGAEVIDATGQFVFPGFIDPHVHLYLPVMGTLAKDDFATGSRAALVGGTTTVIEMCCPTRHDDALDSFEQWQRQAAGRCACDYSFHMGVTRFDARTERQLRAIVKRGVASFKIFLAYKETSGLEDAELYRVLKLAGTLGVIVTAHCESAPLVAELQRDLLAAGRTGPQWHHASRPPRVEAEGVHHLLTFAELTGATVYIVHVSCREALEEALAARRRGVRVALETLTQYLTLDQTCIACRGFEGAKYVMSPPLRHRRNQAVLWRALREGDVQTVASDHAPFDFKTQKAMGRRDFTRIPNGLPSIEERIKLLYTKGVKAGKIDLQTLVRVASTEPAKLFGLYPRKGTLCPGADADLVVFDPEYRGRISARTHHMNVDYSVFEGWRFKGRPRVVTVRGAVVVRDGEFVGEPGWGKFLPRQPLPD